MNVSNFSDTRGKQIDFILSGLHQLRPESEAEKYAIEQNILFFESTRSPFLYFRWLYGVRRQVRAKDLLEINELLPSLDVIFHEKMAEIERRPRPGIIRPVIDYVATRAIGISRQKRFRVASLGSGSMEVERQIVEQLQQKESQKSFTIVGFDISKSTRSFAKKNLSILTDARIVSEAGLTEQRLVELERETKEPVLIVIADNDISTLGSVFSACFFDLVMTSLFLHHLSSERVVRLIKDMRTLAQTTLNYDGYKNEIVMPILSLIGWHSPVFLNAAILSAIRFSNRAEVSRLHTSAKIDFYNHGHYRAIFSS